MLLLGAALLLLGRSLGTLLRTPFPRWLRFTSDATAVAPTTIAAPSPFLAPAVALLGRLFRLPFAQLFA